MNLLVIVSSSLGVILLVAVTFGARTPWPSLPSLAGAPWWGWLGGALGAVYAVATVVLARELGAAPLTALVVTGQLVARSCSTISAGSASPSTRRAWGASWAVC